MSYPRPALGLLVGLALAVGPARAADKEHPLLAQVRASVKDPSRPFTLVVSLQAKQGAGKKVEAAFAPAIKATRKEKGCLAYELNRDTKKPGHFLLYERWQNVDALADHLKSAHITALLKELEEVLAGPPEGRILVPVGDKK